MTDKVKKSGGGGKAGTFDRTVPETVTKPIATDASTSTTMTMKMIDDESERSCWICFATDDDNRLAAWVKPCQCRGTTKWVHQSCLYRWIDEKLTNEHSLRAVACPQCQTEYIVVIPQLGCLGTALEIIDTLISRICPFMTAGLFVCSIYWTAVTFGAVTFLQVVGRDTGMCIMQAADPVLLLIGLPVIPIGLVFLRMIRWENVILRMIHGNDVMEDEVEQLEQEGFLNYPGIQPVTPTESPSPVRVFCGALLLPTIASIMGKIFFESVTSTIQRTLLGGLTFVAIKGVLKIYLRCKQYTSRRNRRIVDYTEENIRTYMAQNQNNNNANGNGTGQEQQVQQEEPEEWRNIF